MTSISSPYSPLILLLTAFDSLIIHTYLLDTDILTAEAIVKHMHTSLLFGLYPFESNLPVSVDTSISQLSTSSGSSIESLLSNGLICEMNALKHYLLFTVCEKGVMPAIVFHPLM